MARLHYNGLTSDGSAGPVTLAAGDTTAFFVRPLPGVSTIVAPDVLLMTVAGGSIFEEIIALTAYTAGALTATCVRNYEATAGGQNNAGAHNPAPWVHGPTAADIPTAISELNASVLVNATSAGAAGPVADHFESVTLNPAWVNEGGVATFVTKYSTAGFSTAAGGSHMLRSWAPTGALRVEARVCGGMPNGDVGILIRDSGTGDGSGEGVMIQIAAYVAGVYVYSLDAGAYNNHGIVTYRGYSNWFYLRLDRDASNNWSGYFSIDRSTWALVGTFAKTLAIAKVGLRSDDPGAACDFFDVVL